jgi:hypothetical protein
MLVVAVLGVALALIAEIGTIDERERAAAYGWVAGWVVCTLGIAAIVTKWGGRPWDEDADGHEDEAIR